MFTNFICTEKSLMEPTESTGQSVGSTTPIALEDDANSSFMVHNLVNQIIVSFFTISFIYLSFLFIFLIWKDANQSASCGGDS